MAKLHHVIRKYTKKHTMSSHGGERKKKGGSLYLGSTRHAGIISCKEKVFVKAKPPLCHLTKHSGKGTGVSGRKWELIQLQYERPQVGRWMLEDNVRPFVCTESFCFLFHEAYT